MPETIDFHIHADYDFFDNIAVLESMIWRMSCDGGYHREHWDECPRLLFEVEAWFSENKIWYDYDYQPFEAVLRFRNETDLMLFKLTWL